MKNQAFTLLEMLVASVLVALVGLIIGGSLRMAVKSWETTQTHIATNYNRRTVLDLLRRQTSSIFYRSEAEEYAREADNSNRNEVDNRPSGVKLTPKEQREQLEERAREMRGQKPKETAANQRQQEEQAFKGFELPEGASYFNGQPQELQFLSTISFLSDFPGQVAVRYYVVQGESAEDGTVELHTLPSASEEGQEPAAEGQEEGEVERMEGNLYLVVEELNLFLSSTLGQDELPAEEETLRLKDGETLRDPKEGGEGTAEEDEPPPGSEVVARNRMVLLGPLRAFELRYRKPAVRGAEEGEDEDDWEDVWDLESQGRYPSAVEFTLFYEQKGSTTLPTEELPGIRMVIPIYDTQNLQRLRDNAPF
jgi:prepilin-type N-terminal cleavage/methylation domain-containing protein